MTETYFYYILKHPFSQDYEIILLSNVWPKDSLGNSSKQSLI